MACVADRPRWQPTGGRLRLCRWSLNSSWFPFSARASRMTIHHSGREKVQGNSFNDYGRVASVTVLLRFPLTWICSTELPCRPDPGTIALI